MAASTGAIAPSASDVRRRPRLPKATSVRLRAFRLMADGVSVARVARRLGVAERTLYLWRAEARRAFELAS